MRLYLSENITGKYLFHKYEPFLQKETPLPSCEIRVFNSHKDKALYTNSDIISDMNSLSPDAMIMHEGKRCFPYLDGVVYQSNDYRENFVFVHNNYKQIDMLIDDDTTKPMNAYKLLLSSYQLVAINAGALLLHASAVIYRGEAIVFCGISGDGKSTQASLWRQYYDAEPINYDHPCVVWKDNIPYACGTPWGGKESYCNNISSPIKAIVFLNKNTHSTVRSVSKGEAFARLVMNNALPPVRSELSAQLMDTVERLVKSIPVFEQEGCLTRKSPDTLYGALYGTGNE